MTLALAICAFIFSFIAFALATGTLVYLLARRFSTVERLPSPEASETIYQYDLPPQIRQDDDGTPVAVPRPPVSMSELEYEKHQRLTAMEARYEEQAADIDF